MLRMLRIQGALDPHVHLRGMEWSNKGTFASETAAALAGGFTAVLDMPNTPPATLGEAALTHKLGELGAQARCDYGAWLGADPRGLPPDDEMRRASRRVCGLKLYCGHTTGGLEIDRELMERYVRAWPGPGTLGLHDEDVMIGEFLDALGRWGKRGHVCHIHSAYSVRHLREAKEAGVQVTAGVTPHHLFLTKEDLPVLGPKAVMKPLLGSAADRDALWEALLEGLIDMVETDHAPHAWEEKQQPNPAFGATGLETCIPLLCTAAAAGRLPLEKIPEWVSEAPRRVFGLPAPSPDTYTLVDLEARWTLDADDLVTACGWSPFEGMELQGRVHKVVLRGRTAFEGGQVLAEPGWGANLYAEDLGGRGGEGDGAGSGSGGSGAGRTGAAGTAEADGSGSGGSGAGSGDERDGGDGGAEAART